MIKNHRTRLLVLASLSLLTTLLALSGIGKGSAGAVARNIECSHKLAHHLGPGRKPQAAAQQPATEQKRTALAILRAHSADMKKPG